MKSDDRPAWKDGEPIPENVDPYRFWFTQQFGENASLTGDFIMPYLVSGDSPDQLRERFEALQKKLPTELYLPEFYQKLYFCNEKKPRKDGPFQIVVLARLGSQGDMLIGDVPGVVAGSMPLPAPVWPGSGEKRPDSAKLADFLCPDRKIKRLIAVIDTDIAFANARFRASADDTLFGWYWDMDANAYPFIGRMMARSHINGYLAGLSPMGASEMRLYRDYARDSFLNPWDALPPPIFGHGTAVLDAAMGGKVLTKDDGTAIIGVQLPRFAVAQTHGQFLWFYVLMALDLVSCLAWLIEEDSGHRPETLVNVSVGGHGGRHDGYSGLEIAMDQRIANGDLDAIFLAAGNSFGERIHASFRGSDLDATKQLSWQIQPDDGTSSFLEIWLPDDSAGQLELSVQAPGEAAQVFSPATLIPGYTAGLPVGGQIAALLSVQRDPLLPFPGIPRRIRILLSVQSTALSPPAFTGATRGLPMIAGDWQIGLKAGPNLGKDDIVTLWISRDDEILRLPTGARQSFFARNSPASGFVVNEGTISDMASGRQTTSVAAHWASDRMMTPYSGRGIPACDAVAGRNIFPVASYVADESEAHPGVSVAGYFSGSVLNMAGTSISAPQAMRLAVTGDLPPSPGQSVQQRVSGLAQADEAALPVDTNPIKAKTRSDGGAKDWGSGRLAFVQRGYDQPGSTNYPRRRRNSV